LQVKLFEVEVGFEPTHHAHHTTYLFSGQTSLPI